MASEGAQHTGFALIVIGSLMSFGRDYLSRFYIRLHGWLRKQPPNERLLPGVTLYLMMTGMILTLVGLMVLFGVIPG